MRINIDNNWKFFLGSLEPQSPTSGWGGAKAGAYNFGATAKTLNDEKWRSVNLPHDFVMEGDYTQKKSDDKSMQKIPEMESIDSRHFAGGSLAGGIAWYRKTFNIDTNKRVYLHFGSVYRDCTVYVNEYLAGRHESGYSSFCYDITDFINDGENLVAVRVDATGREGWWYEGGGICGHVWLEIKDDISHEVFVYSDVSSEDKSAVVNIRAELASKKLNDAVVTVCPTIMFNGNELAKTESKIHLPMWDKAVCSMQIKLFDVKLWDIYDPLMYTLRTDIYENGELMDTKITEFGIRDIRFDADKGFFLNGNNIKLKGLCLHRDNAGVGIAQNESIFEYKISKLKSMGANAIRSSHHMMSEELLSICDKMGMLVFDETRRMSSAPQDLECLREMVQTARNHPCVFLYGIGNEEVFIQHRPEAAKITVTMKAEVKKLDHTRPVTSAVVCWNGVERFENAKNYIDVTKHLDIMGFNYCKSAWDDYRERMPQQPIIITEASTNSSTRGCYSTNETIGQYYIFDSDNEKKCKSKKKAQRIDLGESEWKYFAERDYLAGIFLWTGTDYRGEPTPLSYPAVYSQFGILDCCGFPKDNFYYYKSWWTNEPTLHIFPHPNFLAGKTTDVYCYSNLDEAELFINGKSLGRKSMDRNWYLTWEKVSYESGEVMIKGFKDKKEVMTKILTPSKTPNRIELNAYKTDINVGETAIINVKITDENGELVPDADNMVIFETDGEFLGTANGNPSSHEDDKVPVRRAFCGMCQVLVKADSVGEIKLKARSNGLLSDECIVKVQ